MPIHRAAVLLSALVVTLIACHSTVRAGEDRSDTRTVLTETIKAGHQPQLIAAFYRARKFKPAWTGDERALSHAAEVREVLTHTDAQGLEVKQYTAWKSIDDPASDPKTAARYDIALTRALMLYASDVRVGRFKPGLVYKDVRLPAQKLDLVKELDRAISRRSLTPYLDALPPADPDYRALVVALARYRTIAEAGGWAPVVAGSRESLTKRLAAEDEALAKKVADDDADDDHVSDALKRYETRNGFDATEELSSDVIASLNVPVATRIAAIAANLERRRWMPKAMEDRYIVVNVPDQSVDYVDDGKVLLHSRAVIGKPTTATPILKTAAKSVVVNPPWDIPDFIAAKSLLPHLKKNRNYLAMKNIVLADGPPDDPHGQKINWRKVTAKTIPYQIQQLPGGENALGTLMLDMPNDFDVYIHDTPSKALFEQTSRTRSNGCIRVEKIEELASLVLSGDAEKERELLQRRIAHGLTLRLDLDDPMPVYLVYWTALPGSDGTVGFRPDRYGRDKRLTALFRGTGKDS